MRVKQKIHKKWLMIIHQNLKYIVYIRVYRKEERNFTAVHLF